MTSACDAHVVFLVNFLAPNHVAVCQELSRQLERFTVLCSVDMEGNRNWKPDWKDIDVRVQRTWTWTRQIRHPSGYRDVNYIHVPTDTLARLRELRPDAIVSLEMGARTAMAMTYCKWNPTCAMVTSVYASEQSESGRGRLRTALRKRLLRQSDWVTYNGPSCRRYLQSLGANADCMSPWDYAADPTKPFRGPRSSRGEDSSGTNTTRMLTVGQLSERKGIDRAIDQLRRWATDHSGHRIQWKLVGSGPLEELLRQSDVPENLALHFHGHCDADQLREHYRDSDVLWFPTLTDEWGLVVDEALHSGLPVIGSVHSQAVETLIDDGVNGFRYDPVDEDSFAHAMNQWVIVDPSHRLAMSESARESVRSRTPETSASQLVSAVRFALEKSSRRRELKSITGSVQ